MFLTKESYSKIWPGFENVTWIWCVTSNITPPEELYYAPRIFDLECLARHIKSHIWSHVQFPGQIPSKNPWNPWNSWETPCCRKTPFCMAIKPYRRCKMTKLRMVKSTRIKKIPCKNLYPHAETVTPIYESHSITALVCHSTHRMKARSVNLLKMTTCMEYFWSIANML